MTQTSRDNFLDKQFIVREDELQTLLFSLKKWDRIFFDGEMGVGKSTYIRALLRAHFRDPALIVRSPTYTYYQRYSNDQKKQDSQEWDSPMVYHFDLYRIESVDDLLIIGAMDIFEDPESICLIEWPEKLGWILSPTLAICLERHSEIERSVVFSLG